MKKFRRSELLYSIFPLVTEVSVVVVVVFLAYVL